VPEARGAGGARGLAAGSRGTADRIGEPAVDRVRIGRGPSPARLRRWAGATAGCAGGARRTAT